jgi:hypothetical protein
MFAGRVSLMTCLLVPAKHCISAMPTSFTIKSGGVLEGVKGGCFCYDGPYIIVHLETPNISNIYFHVSSVQNHLCTLLESTKYFV